MFATWRNPTLAVGLLALASGACAQSSAAPDQPDGAVAADATPVVDARWIPDAAAAVDAATPDATPDAPGADAMTSIDAGADAAAPVDTGVLAYQHTITIDGVNDFVTADERLATTTGGTYYGYVSWDADYVYLGMSGDDVAANSGTRWVVVYLGGSAGTTTGVAYNNQQPALPFSARYHVRWKTNNSYTGALEWTGSGWTDPAWDFTGAVYQTGTFVELRIARTDLGSPSQLDLHLAMINEAAGGEWTYAGAPSASFTDGFNQSFARYYRFDLGAASAPASYLPLP
ncbi:MAG TPA: hypothetical protein VML75_08360 [Kofleriaceae bacterium]|nr:hypothetical protein [Kofleriaceae bacterium]